jgi:hypothetical protein
MFLLASPTVTSPDGLCPCGSGKPRSECDPRELTVCSAVLVEPHVFHRPPNRREYCVKHDYNVRRKLLRKAAALERDACAVAKLQEALSSRKTTAGAAS